MYIVTSLAILLFVKYAAVGAALDSNSVAYANNDFTIRLHHKLCEENGNVFFSPLSISIAMAMVLRGTEGETADELKKVLGFNLSDATEEEMIHKNLNGILSELKEKQDSYVFTLANSLFVDKRFQLVKEYVNDLQNLYDAHVLEMNFSEKTRQAVKYINEWVKEQTHGMIPKLFERLNRTTVLILVNAIYFKGSWLYQFDPEYTRPWKFLNYGMDIHSKTVPMMFIKKKFRYMENDVFKALELPYISKDICMLILLSNDYSGLSSLEHNLNPDFIRSLKRQMKTTEVEVSLPKFRMVYSKNLKDTLKSLGLHKVFSSEGSFLRMTQASDDLNVSEIEHRAVLEVNEVGSEAAAATAAVLENRCLKIIPEFFVDHPFLFAIYNRKNDIILFFGRVEKL